MWYTHFRTDGRLFFLSRYPGFLFSKRFVYLHFHNVKLLGHTTGKVQYKRKYSLWCGSVHTRKRPQTHGICQSVQLRGSLNWIEWLAINAPSNITIVIILWQGKKCLNHGPTTRARSQGLQGKKPTEPVTVAWSYSFKSKNLYNPFTGIMSSAYGCREQ